MDKDKIHNLLNSANYIFAKTMANIPHEYTKRDWWRIDSDFVDVVIYIRKFGKEESFFGKKYIYYYLDGYKYWTMGNPVSYADKSKTFILNRARI